MNCTFTDASTDPDGNDTIAEWNWIFGDGNSSAERNPTHAYTAPAEYQVRLTVTDDGVLSDEAGPRTVSVAESAGDEEG